MTFFFLIVFFCSFFLHAMKHHHSVVLHVALSCRLMRFDLPHTFVVCILIRRPARSWCCTYRVDIGIRYASFVWAKHTTSHHDAVLIEKKTTTTRHSRHPRQPPPSSPHAVAFPSTLPPHDNKHSLSMQRLCQHRLSTLTTAHPLRYSSWFFPRLPQLPFLCVSCFVCVCV